MSDIFLSHVVDDTARATKLAALFLERHWTVCRDPCALIPNHHTDDSVAKELENAKAVVVLWSNAANDLWPGLRMTLERAGTNRLVPVWLEKNVMSPPEFPYYVAFD